MHWKILPKLKLNSLAFIEMIWPTCISRKHTNDTHSQCIVCFVLSVFNDYGWKIVFTFYRRCASNRFQRMAENVFKWCKYIFDSAVEVYRKLFLLLLLLCPFPSYLLLGSLFSHLCFVCSRGDPELEETHLNHEKWQMTFFDMRSRINVTKFCMLVDRTMMIGNRHRLFQGYWVAPCYCFYPDLHDPRTLCKKRKDAKYSTENMNSLNTIWQHIGEQTACCWCCCCFMSWNFILFCFNHNLKSLDWQKD